MIPRVPSAPRTRLTPVQRRAQLLELGIEMLSENRLEDVAIDHISHLAGISRGLLFHYFPSKRDFHLAVVEAAAQHLLDRTEPDPHLPVMKQLRSSVEAFVDYLAEHRTTYISLVRGASGSDPDLQAIFERTRRAIGDRILDRLGVTDPLPGVLAVIRGWVAFADEVSLDWLAQDAPELTRDGLIELLEESLVALIQVAAAHSR